MLHNRNIDIVVTVATVFAGLLGVVSFVTVAWDVSLPLLQLAMLGLIYTRLPLPR